MKILLKIRSKVVLENSRGVAEKWGNFIKAFLDKKVTKSDQHNILTF